MPMKQLSTLAEVRREWRKNNLEAWEKMWEEHPKSKWTHWLFPKVQKYIDQPSGPPRQLVATRYSKPTFIREPEFHPQTAHVLKGMRARST